MIRKKIFLRVLLVLLLLMVTFSFQKYVPAVRAAGLWTTVAPLPEVREGAAGAAINGLVYVMKGYSLGDTGDVRIYNPLTNSWSNGNPSFNIGSEFYQGATVNGKAYVIGGRPVFAIGSLVDIYDPATNSWSQGAPMPTPRAGHATALVNGLIYVIGGRTGSAPFQGQILSTVEVYNPATNSWSTAQSMPAPRSDLAAAVVGGVIYAVGGWNGNTTVGTVEAFNPSTGVWTEKAPMPTARGTLGAAVCGSQGTIRAIGGVSSFNSTLATNEAYDPVANSWTQDTPLNVGRGEVTLVNFDANTIYAVGGGFFGLSVSDAEVFHCPTAPVTGPGISLSASPSTLTVTQGGSAGSNITVSSVNGFKGKVSLSASVQPGGSGVTGSFNPSSLTIHGGASGVSVLTVTATMTATLGTVLLAVNAVDGGNVSATADILLMVLPSAGTKVPNFAITASPTVFHFTAGSEGVGSVIANSINGFSGTVRLSITTNPPGSPAVLFANSISLVPNGASSTLFAVFGSFFPSTFTVHIDASATLVNGTTHHSATIKVLTQDFFVFSPIEFSQLIMHQGDSASFPVETTSLNGLSGTVTFSITALPPNIFVSVSPSSFFLAPNSTVFSTLTVSVAPNTPGGTFNIAVTATSVGVLLRGFVFTLIVPDFSVSTSTPSLSLVLQKLVGGNATVTVKSFLGFSLPVSLSTSWLGAQPSGVSISLIPSTVQPPPGGSSSAVLTLSIAKGATLGTFILHLTGSVPNLTRSADITITIVKSA